MLALIGLMREVKHA